MDFYFLHPVAVHALRRVDNDPLFELCNVVTHAGNEGFLFLLRAVDQIVQQIFNVRFPLQGFYEQGMPFVIRALRGVLDFPILQEVEVISQHPESVLFFLPVLQFLAD